MDSSFSKLSSAMGTEEYLDVGIFDEPEEFKAPEVTFHSVEYKRYSVDPETGKDIAPTKLVDPSSVTVNLVSASPLWGHLLWNAGKFTAIYLDNHPELVDGKRILELGAAGGLPSLICGLHNPTKLVCTDYPDAALVNNIKTSFEQLNLSKNQVLVDGYIWGNDTSEITKFNDGQNFDLIILSDLVFNHTEHHKLLSTCKKLVAPNGKCLVVFSPHRAWLLKDDLEFFDKAQDDYQFKVDKIDLVTWTPMFEEEDETKDVRGKVYSFWLVPGWN